MVQHRMKNNAILEIADYLPPQLSKILHLLDSKLTVNLEEVRLRKNKPLLVCGCGLEYFLDANGKPVERAQEAYIVTQEDVDIAVQLMCNFSLYAVEEEIRNGFVTLNGGHRVGLCGKVVMENHTIRTIKDIAFLNYRIAKEIIGAGDKVIPYLIRSPDVVYNTLIISPPQCGKTTLLRDIIRQLSNGNEAIKGKKIAIVDERSEIAACIQGLPRNDVGIRTDVLDGCPKAEGIIMMIRSMSPDIVATDEIGKYEDAAAILDALNAGVSVITTIHGSDFSDFLRKPGLEKLRNNLFERIIILSNRNGVGTVEHILDENYQDLLARSRL